MPSGEGPFAGAGQDDHLHGRVVVEFDERLAQGGPQRLGERIHRLGAVQRDDGDGVLAFDEQHGGSFNNDPSTP
jgi:hypothetical protein